MKKLTRKLTISGCVMIILFLCFFRDAMDLTVAGNSGRQAKKYEPVTIQTPQIPEGRQRLFNKSFTLFEQANFSLLHRRPLLVTIVNDGYLSLTYNWLCHTKKMKDVHKNLLILALDRYTKAELIKRWPKVSVATIASGNYSLSGNLHFNTVGYIRMIARRTEAVNELVQAGIPLVLFETDFVWYQNPLPDFVTLGQTKQLDMVGTKSAVQDQLMCGGFIYFRDTEPTRKVWAEVVRLVKQLEASMAQKKNRDRSPWKENEQRYLNALLETHFGGVQYGLVSYSKTASDGMWYMLSDENKVHKPKVVHNNFLITVAEKVARFKKFDQWVLREDGSCDTRKVTQLLRQRRNRDD